MQLQERRIDRMVTRASFVGFLFWAFVMLAAGVGYRASKITENTRWIGCTFKKSVILLFIASGLGIWKLHLNFKIHDSVKRFKREMIMSNAKNGFGSKHQNGPSKSDWMFREMINLTPEQ